MAAETALRVAGSSSAVCNLNGSQRRPIPLSPATRFLGLPPRASPSSSISSSLSQFLASVRIGSRLPISRHQQGKRRNFSVFAVAAEGTYPLFLFYFSFYDILLSYAVQIVHLGCYV